MVYRKAILIIHGFAGGVYDEEALTYRLIPNRKFDVYTFTLPGHSSNLSSDVTYQDWIKSADDHVEMLKKIGYKKIYVVGHSMGGVLAAYLATKHKEVKKVVLAAPAFEYIASENENKLLNLVKNSSDIIKTYHFKEILARALKVSPSMLKQFTKLVEKLHNCPSSVHVPILIIQGDNDKIVPLTSSKYVFENVKSNYKHLVIANKVTHDIFKSEKQDMIIDIIEQFLKKNYMKGNIISKI